MDHGNLRLALDWSAESPENHENGLRLSAALCRYWEVRNYLKEGLEHFAALLAPGEDGEPSAVRAKALGAAGRLAWCQDDDAKAAVYLREAIRCTTAWGWSSRARCWTSSWASWTGLLGTQKVPCPALKSARAWRGIHRTSG